MEAFKDFQDVFHPGDVHIIEVGDATPLQIREHANPGAARLSKLHQQR